MFDRLVRFAVPLSLLAVMAACGPKPGGATDGGAGGATSEANGTDSTPGLQSAPPQLTAESLNVDVRAWSEDQTVPSKIVIDVAHDIADSGQLQQAPKDTVLRIEPHVKGRLVIRSPTRITFEPETPFAFGTKYSVRLESIGTPAGVLKPPSPASWRTEFQTPGFEFVRMSTHGLDYGRSALTVHLVFSGPVSLASVKSLARFRAGSSGELQDVQFAATDKAHVIAATLRSPRLRPSTTVALTLQDGVASSAEPSARAPAATASVTLPGGKPLTIQAAHLKEGDDGFYVEVICDDSSVGTRRYFYDHEIGDGWSVSSRCQLAEADAKSFIRLNPDVPFQLVPGRAGFRILADLPRGPVSVSISAGAVSTDGGVLLKAFDHDFEVPGRKPRVSFSSTGRYLPKSAWRNLALQHVNVSELDLWVRQVPPENLVFWLTQDRETADDRTSDLLVNKKLTLSSPADKQHTTWVDLASLLPATTRGVLEITAHERGGGATASSRLLLTDMTLIAKKSTPPPDAKWKQEVFVWAIGMEDIQPLSGVELSLKRKSGKTVATCTTDRTGGCRLTVGDTGDADQSEPFAIIARKGEDLTYVRYADLKTETSEFDVQGEPFLSERVYRAAVWTDRGVYRPGETARVAAIIRDRENLAPKAGLPVEVQLFDPRTRVVRQTQAQTNEAGMLELSFPFTSFADTGSYKAELTIGKKVVGRAEFNVEEFVPERMKVEVKPLEAAYGLSDKAKMAVRAQYLFGGSAEGSQLQLTCRIEPSEFKPKEHANFSYGLWSDEGDERKTLALGQVEGTLDASGQAAVECPELSGSGAFPGAARLVAQAAVFEAGSGRSTVGASSVPVHPERYYLGLQTGAQKAVGGKPFTVEGVVVDWNGALSPRSVEELEVEFVRLESEYGYYWDEEDGTESYGRHLRPVIDGRTQVKVSGGKFKIEVKPSGRSEGYVVRVKAGGARTDLHVPGEGRGYYWDRGDTTVDQTPRPLKPTTLSVSLPTEVQVGAPTKVTFRAPFKGRVLMTAETHRVVSHEWLDVQPGEVSWSVTLREFAPNVYVSAFLVKDPHLESKESFLPDRAFGVATARVAPKDFTQELSLELPKEVRSNSKLEVKLHFPGAAEATYATVAVVDEGILSLTGFKSPNPFESIFTRRSLGVETYETVGWTLLMPPSGNSRRTGGDEEGEEGADGPGRVQPVKPVALWSGLVKVPADGKLVLPFDIPQYRGKLRVMAVAAGAKRMARASGNVTVRDPLVLQTTLPRFALYGDVMQIPVFVTNLSGAPQEVKVSLAAEALPVVGAQAFSSPVPPLQFLGKSEGTAKLEDGKSATLVFQAKATLPIGAAKLRVIAKSARHESREELDVPFLPNGPRERMVQKLELASGRLDLKPYLEGWLPTSERSTFWVTGNPYGESFDHLAYLVRYPYGCIEQTTSSTRPLLFVSGLLNDVDPTLVASGKLEDMVMHGVNRVLSMQTPAGGFGYWVGDTTPTAWGSAYATHMLLDAQKAGYKVPQARLDGVLAWMEGEVNRYENGGSRNDYHDVGAEPYMHYVLAMSGKGRKARILRLIEEGKNQTTRDGQRDEEQYLLKAALYLAGDRRYERDLKNPDVSPIAPERRNNWSFYSDLRRRGFVLSTFQDLFGSDAAGEALAARVASGLVGQRSSYYTTQELVWGVTGLGKRVAGNAKDFDAGALIANGKKLKGQTSDPNRADRSWSLARASEYKELALDVEDTGKGKLFLVMSSEGVRSDGKWRFGGNGLSLKRTWRTIDGEEIDPAGGMKLADLAFVEIEITNTTRERVQNIALVDRLPAGWEIENPRLGRGSPVSWLDANETWTADSMNVRDDRLEVFGALNAGERRKVVYAVRAVTSGTFTLPPIDAEAMYDPTIWAREPGGMVEIAGGWEDFLL